MSEQPVPETHVPHVFEDPATVSLASVYATALLDAQGDVSSAERLEELQGLLENVLAANPKFETLLTSPRVTRSEKEALLDRAILPHASQFFGHFLKVLAARDRLELLRPIYTAAVKELQERQKQRSVTVRTAAPLNDDQLQSIRQRLSEKLSAEPIIQVEIDPTILGGLVIQVGDTVYDSSLRNRLGQLQSRLRQRYVHEIQSGRDRFSHPEGS
ncbi:ATP synthase F1 subunit delta [Rubinisphaera sp. JC750]|uniref:ATP synthase F1 subunit delta n=1 Tax=Rubinisphaera sp. JC750 TaxID=2898658 RepID=UPI001F00DDE5|nr:ATP synthase F1 subunit delta [Rubinisphaera sp. JC750]